MTPVEVAMTQIGVKETGVNGGIPAERYNEGDEVAWCASFIMYCYRESSIGPFFVSMRDYYAMRRVQTMEDRLRDRGCWFGRQLVDMLEPGDIVFYGDRGGSDHGAGRHVGLVTSAVEGLPQMAFTTIEGNYGDAVQERRIMVTDRKITGFARPRLMAWP